MGSVDRATALTTTIDPFTIFLQLWKGTHTGVWKELSVLNLALGGLASQPSPPSPPPPFTAFHPLDSVVTHVCNDLQPQRHR